MTRSLLGDKALSYFNTAADTTGYTTDDLHEFLDYVVDSVFPEHAGIKQKRWMKCKLYRSKAMKVKDFIQHVCDLS